MWGHSPAWAAQGPCQDAELELGATGLLGLQQMDRLHGAPRGLRAGTMWEVHGKCSRRGGDGGESLSQQCGDHSHAVSGLWIEELVDKLSSREIPGTSFQTGKKTRLADTASEMFMLCFA